MDDYSAKRIPTAASLIEVYTPDLDAVLEAQSHLPKRSHKCYITG